MTVVLCYYCIDDLAAENQLTELLTSCKIVYGTLNIYKQKIYCYKEKSPTLEEERKYDILSGYKVS